MGGDTVDGSDAVSAGGAAVSRVGGSWSARPGRSECLSGGLEGGQAVGSEVLVEFAQVVAGGDQEPFAAGGVQSA